MLGVRIEADRRAAKLAGATTQAVWLATQTMKLLRRGTAKPGHSSAMNCQATCTGNNQMSGRRVGDGEEDAMIAAGIFWLASLALLVECAHRAPVIEWMN